VERVEEHVLHQVPLGDRQPGAALQRLEAALGNLSAPGSDE
jgi:hypothetical protein